MRKLLLNISMGAFLVSGTTLSSFDIGNYTSKAGSISYVSDITNSLTDCISDKLANLFPLGDFDICSIENKLNAITDSLDDKIKKAFMLDVKFNLAGCSFSAQADPTKCLRGRLHLYCNSASNPLRKNLIKSAIQNHLTSATSSYATYADSELLGNVCMTFEEKQKKAPNHTKVYGTTKYEEILAKHNGGIYVNTRVGKNILRCIEDAKQNGYNENSCYPEYDEVDSSGEEAVISESKVKISIHTEATETLASPFENRAGEERNKEVDLSSKLLKECGNSISTSQADRCTTDVLNNGYGLIEDIDTANIDITKSIAAYRDVVDEATTPHDVLFQTSSTIAQSIMSEKKEDYNLDASRQMAREAIIQSEFRQIEEIEKELSVLMYKKLEISSKPFFIKATKQELGIVQ